MTMHARTTLLTRGRTAAAIAALAVSLSACSLIGGEDTAAADGDTVDVVLVTHDSFDLPDELVAQFNETSGYRLVVTRSGDAGALSAKLALTADNPSGDIAYGIDNTFASRTLDADVFAPHSAELPAGAEAYALDDGSDLLAPIGRAAVCVNVDQAWFDEAGVKAPRTLEDLAKPAYEDLMVVPSAATSSPGMAFLLTTHAAFGDDWASYWGDLLDNGLKIVEGWSDAYYADFTAGSEKGKRPIVLSYDSSPAFTVDGSGESSTRALLDTCFNQVEYAGVLAGAANPEGAEAVVEFLLSDEVQAALPNSMYVYPVSAVAELPDDWATWAPSPATPWEIAPTEIAANRDIWLRDWTEVVTR